MSTPTYEPTERKLRRAREQGDVPMSAEWMGAAGLCGLVGALWFFGDGLARAWRSLMESCFASIQPGEAEVGLVMNSVAHLATVFASMLAVIVGLVAVAGVAHVGPRFVMRRLGSDQSVPHRSQRRIADLVKSLLGQLTIVSVPVVLGYRELRGIVGLIERSAADALVAAGRLLFVLLLATAVVSVLVAMCDVIYQRWQYRRGLRMTREELRRELRETEGDPWQRRQRRRQHREVSQSFSAER